MQHETGMTIIRFFFCMAIAIVLTGCISSAPRYSSSDPPSRTGGEDPAEYGISDPTAAPHPVDTTTLMRIIGEFLGTPYDHGGETDQGIDCSAFTQSVFIKTFAISLPRSTEEQYRIGQKIGRHGLTPGDLVFFNTTGRVPSHVGIFIGGGQFAHASVTEGVTITSLSAPYYSRRYVGARRVLP